MDDRINWENEIKKIAEETSAEVYRKFFDYEMIDLNMSCHIRGKIVYGLLSEKRLNDKWNTVAITYCLIDRKDIVLDQNSLCKTALEVLQRILKHPDWQEIKDAEDFREFLRDNAEFAIGSDLKRIFAATARANPDKYPKYQTHGHEVKRWKSENSKIKSQNKNPE